MQNYTMNTSVSQHDDIKGTVFINVDLCPHKLGIRILRTNEIPPSWFLQVMIEWINFSFKMWINHAWVIRIRTYVIQYFDWFTWTFHPEGTNNYSEIDQILKLYRLGNGCRGVHGYSAHLFGYVLSYLFDFLRFYVFSKSIGYQEKP